MELPAVLAPGGRIVDEWIGATPDTAIPKRVRVRVFDRYGGRCYKSGRKIMPGDVWQVDHIVALINGGENRESNLAPILDAPHKEKSAGDVAIKAKTARIRAKHLGLDKIGKRPWPSRPFPKDLRKARKVTA